MVGRAEHWNSVYEQKAATEVSWYQPEAAVSLELFDACRLPNTAAIVDIGAGASTFVDGVLARGYTDITLLDISERALRVTRERLPHAQLKCQVGDVTGWQPPRSFDLWHDRAVFHFLTEASDRDAYRSVLAAALPSGAHAIIGTFALDGPERCSGLPVQRYSAETLAAELGTLLRPIESRSQRHRTPGGSEQAFVFVRFERI
jgi:SAM-dependent methyltransferase